MTNSSDPGSPLSDTPLPPPWVTRFGRLVPDGGTVLDLACGGGRNGRWFLARGMQVTFLDRDTEGLSDLSEVPAAEIVRADLETGGPFPLAGRRFDCVVVTNYLWRGILGDILACVTPGGLLIYETFGVGNAAYGRPRNPDFLLAPGELADEVRADFDILGYEHGSRTRPSPAVIQRIAAIKRTAS